MGFNSSGGQSRSATKKETRAIEGHSNPYVLRVNGELTSHFHVLATTTATGRQPLRWSQGEKRRGTRAEGSEAESLEQSSFVSIVRSFGF